MRLGGASIMRPLSGGGVQTEKRKDPFCGVVKMTIWKKKLEQTLKIFIPCTKFSHPKILSLSLSYLLINAFDMLDN